MTVVRGGPVLRLIDDRHPPGPARSVLADLAGDEPVFAQFPIALASHPSRLFGVVDALRPAVIPAMDGLTLMPWPARDLRRALAAANIHATLLKEEFAEVIIVNSIRRHRERYNNSLGRRYNQWLLYAYRLGAKAVPLLYTKRVQPEIIRTIAKIGDLTTAKATA